MQENDPLKSNNHDDQPHIDSEQNDQQQTDLEQEKPTQDTPQEQPSEPSKNANLPAWLRAEVGDSPEEQEKQTQNTPQEQPSGPPTNANRIAWSREEIGHLPERPSEPSTSANRIAWSREEIGHLPAQPSAPSTSANKIAWSREEIGHLPEQRQIRTLSYQGTPERGGCLTAWLIFLGIGSALGMLLALVTISQNSVFGLLALVGGVLSLIGVSGTWRFKRWGYYLLMTLYGINLAFSVLGLCAASGNTPFSLGSIIGAIIAMFILYLLVHDRWSAFE